MTSDRNRKQSINTDQRKRRLKTKPLLFLIGLLLIGNMLWFIAWLIPNRDVGPKEEVASVDGKPITRQEWMAEMEKMYGKETLLNLVNERVMEVAAEKYEIPIEESEIDLEMALIRSAQDRTTTLQSMDVEQLREKMRSQLILEKVLTKDVVIEKEEIEAYYKENEALYNIPTAYRTSMIVTATKAEADDVIAELKNGSNFDVLARERSLHRSSANFGGDIGYITGTQSEIDSAIVQAAKEVDINEWSQPVELSDGQYAVVTIDEVAEGQSFSFDEVKDHVKRELALEQLPQSVTPEVFWDEFKAKWFYGE